MNNTLKHWREAATLIIAAGCQPISAILKITTEGTWHGHQKKAAFDYEVLMLQRSQKSGFMANAFVFPGGLVEPSDFSNDWVKVFEKHAQNLNFGLGMVKQPLDTRSPMFSTDRRMFGSMIPSEVAFRICAIRETFEESGILLVVPANSDIENNQNFMAAYEQNLDMIARWREEVQSDPLQFIEMCRELQCVPNIWALHEWCNWMTPLSKKSRARRYDTAFYICCLPRKPFTMEDKTEVITFKWWTPQEALDQSEHEIWLPLPQQYELRRLCNFTLLKDLQQFALHRGLEGCERWLPVFVLAKDGMVHTMPGDDLYPDDPDFTGQTERIYSTDRTIEELVQDGGRQHRLINVDGVPRLIITIQMKYKHLKPMRRQHDKEPKSQL